MIVEEFIIIFTEIILITLLSYKYIKKCAPENLVIVPIIVLLVCTYIFFTIKSKYIPLILQICLILFGYILPLVLVALQYNNIIIARKILYYRMKYLFNLKEYEQTIDYINKLIAYEGRKAEYMYILGICYKNLNDYINARDSFALAVDLDKKDFKSYYELGHILDETNKTDTAIVMFNKAIRIKPDFYEAREALGICYTRQGKFKEAINVYKKALEKFPNSYELYYNIAIIEIELDKLEEAKASFKKAGEIKKDLYSAFYNLGNIHLTLSEYEDAINEYRKVLSSGIYGPKAYYKIATVYAIKREYEKAMASLEYAIELDPIYIKKAKEDFTFSKMQNVINRYLIDKEILENKEKQRRNYMKNTFKIFSKKDILEDYSKNYSTEIYQNKVDVKQA